MLEFLKIFLEYFSGLFSEFSIYSFIIPINGKYSVFQDHLDLKTVKSLGK